MPAATWAATQEGPVSGETGHLWPGTTAQQPENLRLPAIGKGFYTACTLANRGTLRRFGGMAKSVEKIGCLARRSCTIRDRQTMENIMNLEGSCDCGSVRFSVETDTPYPYNRCYCSICRKTAGGGGYAINIMARADTLRTTGKGNLAVYRAAKNDRESYEEDGLSPSHRNFCSKCGSALWVQSARPRTDLSD